MLYILLVTVWFYHSTGREAAVQAFPMDEPGQCLELRDKVIAAESARSDVRLVRATCLAVSAEGNTI